MKRFFIAFSIVGAWASFVWADCKPRDYYTRSAKIYISPSQGKQDLKRAEQLITAARNCYPDDPEVQYLSGWLSYQKKEFAKMMEVLVAAIQSHPEWRPKAETLRAIAFQETFEQAYGYLEKGMRATTAKDSSTYFREAIKLYHGCILIDSTATGP